MGFWYHGFLKDTGIYDLAPRIYGIFAQGIFNGLRVLHVGHVVMCIDSGNVHMCVHGTSTGSTRSRPICQLQCAHVSTQNSTVHY